MPLLRQVAASIGRVRCAPLYRDPLFLAALGAGPVFWFGLGCWSTVRPMAPADAISWSFLALTLWQPCLEELLFRGGLQGSMRAYTWGGELCHGVTSANVLTSCLFMLGHFWSHPPLWAAAVFFPSLLFGYFRDRYTSVSPSIVLHIFYNVGYFALTGGR